MKTPKCKLQILKSLTVACVIVFAATALAQNYAVDWYKISGGGGTSTGGVYSVSGTIGQTDASGAMTGGNYSVTGGFWSLIALVQSTTGPALSIAHTGNSA